jgi:hypothetical protein
VVTLEKRDTMRPMKRPLCIVLLALSGPGCGSGLGGGQDVKTPDQLIEDQDKQAQEDEKNKKRRGVDESYSGEETDQEKKRKFDKKQTKLELQRATLSAESCPGVVFEQEGKEHPRGEFKATVTFQEDGTVRQVTIPSPFDGKPVGDCVIQAYKHVIIPPYVGGEQIVDWDVNLKDQKPDKGGDKAKKK